MSPAPGCGAVENSGGGKKESNEPVPWWHFAVIWNFVGGQNGPTKSWTKNLAETLAPLLLGID
jgi:hypothetical protein